MFLHWPVPAATLRPFVPEPLRIQEFGGTAWIGMVPFRLRDIARRPFPPIPGVSGFPELNVRTYVEHDEGPGLWFLSIDAPNRLANWTARQMFGFPYQHAKINYVGEARMHFQSHRRNTTAGFQATFEPKNARYSARPGTLEHFLTERYRFTTHGRGGSLRTGVVHHEAWPLQDADCTIHYNSMLEPYGIPSDSALSRTPVLVNFSRRVDSVVWPATRLRT
jgi:uncharacterized protein YqjF (DUF2071 family)